ncbi:hypothetical protein BJ992_002890 [Sphaerisporangium rubeum]|uniref:Uncharacterized protein n=1 Tax=Sphaerisporangium rubeum TaxID=321317 RepID=A0A7X0IDX0_9ACTN|nr:hypothetical protein [Sphaerisporangium rubeum]
MSELAIMLMGERVGDHADLVSRPAVIVMG